jgi:hypothetical protein
VFRIADSRGVLFGVPCSTRSPRLLVHFVHVSRRDTCALAPPPHLPQQHYHTQTEGLHSRRRPHEAQRPRVQATFLLKPSLEAMPARVPECSPVYKSNTLRLPRVAASRVGQGCLHETLPRVKRVGDAGQSLCSGVLRLVQGQCLVQDLNGMAPQPSQDAETKLKPGALSPLIGLRRDTNMAALRHLLVERTGPLHPAGRWRSCNSALQITGCGRLDDSFRLLGGPLHRVPMARKPPCHRRRDLACGFKVRIRTPVRRLLPSRITADVELGTAALHLHIGARRSRFHFVSNAPHIYRPQRKIQDPLIYQSPLHQPQTAFEAIWGAACARGHRL